MLFYLLKYKNLLCYCYGFSISFALDYNLHKQSFHPLPNQLIVVKFRNPVLPWSWKVFPNPGR